MFLNSVFNSNEKFQYFTPLAPENKATLPSTSHVAVTDDHLTNVLLTLFNRLIFLKSSRGGIYKCIVLCFLLKLVITKEQQINLIKQIQMFH